MGGGLGFHVRRRLAHRRDLAEESWIFVASSPPAPEQIPGRRACDQLGSKLEARSRLESESDESEEDQKSCSLSADSLSGPSRTKLAWPRR